MYVGNETRSVLLVQTPDNERAFSIRIGGDRDGLPETYNWGSDDIDENRVLFHSVVLEILDADDMVSGKYDLQKPFALFCSHSELWYRGFLLGPDMNDGIKLGCHILWDGQ